VGQSTRQVSKNNVVLHICKNLFGSIGGGWTWAVYRPYLGAAKKAKVQSSGFARPMPLLVLVRKPTHFPREDENDIVNDALRTFHNIVNDERLLATLGSVSRWTPGPNPQAPNLDGYLAMHVATWCDEHGVYVTKDLVSASAKGDGEMGKMVEMCCPGIVVGFDGMFSACGCRDRGSTIT